MTPETHVPGATYGDASPAPALAADAFAMLWAHEQGEPLPTIAPPPPIELGEQTVDAVVRRLTDGVAARVTEGLAERISEGLAPRIIDGLASRVTDGLVARVTEDLAHRMTDALAEQVMQNAFGDSLRQTVHDVSERLVREEIARIRAAASTDSTRRDS
jgi:Arc/MetJ family transcription regulator